jgi:hypothetical protein
MALSLDSVGLRVATRGGGHAVREIGELTSLALGFHPGGTCVGSPKPSPPPAS